MAVIVVVDDRVTNRKILVRLAKAVESFVTVEAFEDPELALEWMAGNSPDLIVTDYKMPSMTGADFVRRCRERGSEVPVIVITAYEDQFFRYRALEAGATDFLLSPVDHREFQSRARNLLRLSKDRRQEKARSRMLEEKQAEAESKALDADRLRRIFDVLPLPACVTGPVPSANFTNEEYRRVFLSPSHASASLERALGSERLREVQAREDAATGGGGASLVSEESWIDRHGRTRRYKVMRVPLANCNSGLSSLATTYQELPPAADVRKVEGGADETQMPCLSLAVASAWALNQSFHAIRSLSGLLDAGEARGAEILARIGEALDTGGRVVGALQDLTLLQGEMSARFSRFATPTMIDGLFAQCADEAKAKGVALRRIGRDLAVRSDRLLLERLLKILLSYALSRSHGGRVLVCCRQQGGMARIEIHDEGVPVPGAFLADAIAHRLRAPETLCDGLPGAVGLALAAGIAARLGHAVNCVRRPSSSKVWVTLPVDLEP